MQVGIYKINTNIFKGSSISDSLEKISAIIESKNYLEQDIKILPKSCLYKIKIYYEKHHTFPGWKDFLKPLIENNQDILKEKQSRVESFVVFFLPDKSENLYAVVGGGGYFAIQEYIDEDFGLDIFSRLITKEDNIIKGTRERSFVGSLYGSTKFFRKNYNLFENDNFGKIYQEFKADLDKDILIKRFGFSVKEIKKNSICVAKSSFKINKSINFNDIYKIIDGCEFVYKNEESIPLNNVKKITKRTGSVLLPSLENKLNKQLWERFQKGSDYSIDFDLCHKEYDKYLTASIYKIKKDSSSKNYFSGFEPEELTDLDIIFEQIANLKKVPDNFITFCDLISSLKIYSYDENGDDLTSGFLIDHIHGDVEFNDNKYFYIDKNWYLIKEVFLERLDECCGSFINKKFYEGLDKKWDYENNTENQYNQEYIGDKNTIVLDTITPENIEPCDILKWDEENLYLCHVKAKFGNTMRDLCSQIFISANRIAQDKNSKKEYIEKIYDRLVARSSGIGVYSKKIAQQTSVYSKDDFIKLFDKNLVFILCVLDTASKERNLKKEITKFNSNIAKFSLQELVKEMKGLDSDFKITQIFRK